MKKKEVAIVIFYNSNHYDSIGAVAESITEWESVSEEDIPLLKKGLWKLKQPIDGYYALVEKPSQQEQKALIISSVTEAKNEILKYDQQREAEAKKRAAETLKRKERQEAKKIESLKKLPTAEKKKLLKELQKELS